MMEPLLANARMLELYKTGRWSMPLLLLWRWASKASQKVCRPPRFVEISGRNWSPHKLFSHLSPSPNQFRRPTASLYTDIQASKNVCSYYLPPPSAATAVYGIVW